MSLLLSKRGPRTNLQMGGQGAQTGLCPSRSLCSRLAASTLNSTWPCLSTEPHEGDIGHKTMIIIFTVFFQLCLSEGKWVKCCSLPQHCFSHMILVLCFADFYHEGIWGCKATQDSTGEHVGWREPNTVISTWISLTVTLGKSPAMNHLSMHVQTLFCRQLVGKVQDGARNNLNEAVLLDEVTAPGQGLSAVLSPLSSLLRM